MILKPIPEVVWKIMPKAVRDSIFPLFLLITPILAIITFMADVKNMNEMQAIVFKTSCADSTYIFIDSRHFAKQGIREAVYQSI